MPVSYLDIEECRKAQPKLPQSLKFVFVGLLMAAAGFQFMDGRAYFSIRDIVGHLADRVLNQHSSSLEAIKEAFSSSSSAAAAQRGRYSNQNDKDRISENFPITEMQLPTLFNLILPPHGKEAIQLGVPSRPTLLYDLSLANISSSTRIRDVIKSPPAPLNPKKGHVAYPLSATEIDTPSDKQESGDGGKKKGRKLRFWNS
ncbi:hypothetical protein Ndes2526B_g09117 [Nannochloris sp. 'desiccata']